MLDPAYYHLTGTSTGRMSKDINLSVIDGGIEKIIMNPPSPLKYLAAKSLAEGGEWYTWDDIEKGEAIID